MQVNIPCKHHRYVPCLSTHRDDVLLLLAGLLSFGLNLESTEEHCDNLLKNKQTNKQKKLHNLACECFFEHATLNCHSTLKKLNNCQL